MICDIILNDILVRNNVIINQSSRKNTRCTDKSIQVLQTKKEFPQKKCQLRGIAENSSNI